MFVTLLGFLLAAAATFPLSSSAPVDFLAPQTLPAGCRLEVITVQEEVEETKVEKVVCETEFRPTCTVKLEKDCRNVTRPACEVSEKMECVENTVSQCSFETRLGSTGEEEQVEVCRDIPIEDCQLVKEEKCRDGEVEEVEECDEKEVEECEIVPHEECHQVTVELPRLQDKQVQQIVCDQENEIEDTTTTEKIAQQESNDDIEENVLENNYDEILDAVNTIFGSGPSEDVNEEEVKVVATTEAETLATEEPLPTTTILPSVPTTATTNAPTTTTTAPTTTTTTTTTEAATTTESTSTTSETATSETVEIVTEAVFVSSTIVPTEAKTDNSKIHFRDDGPVRDFTKRIFVDDGLVDARRKAIVAQRKAASDASRIFFPSEEEGGASIPS
jgi:hypothetical protein